MRQDSRYLSFIGLAVGLLLVLWLVHPQSGSSTTTTVNYTAANAGTLSFAVNDQSIGYGISPARDNLQVQMANLDMLESTGASCIRADIGYGPWLTGDASTEGLISQTVERINMDGKCLIIADAASETYRGNGCLSWANFQNAWALRVLTLASDFKPDYYIVVKEPGWYVPLVCDAQTNPAFQNVQSWLNLTQHLINAVHSVSPTTQVGIAVAGGSLSGSNHAFYYQYLNDVQALPGLAFVGDDLYGQSDQNALSSYLAANHPMRAVWIAEAWSQPTPTNASQAQSDAAWMKSMGAYAHQIGASFLIPFYTDLFSGYTVPTTSSGFVTFYQGRTPVFDAFQKLAMT